MQKVVASDRFGLRVGQERIGKAQLLTPFRYRLLPINRNSVKGQIRRHHLGRRAQLNLVFRIPTNMPVFKKKITTSGHPTACGVRRHRDVGSVVKPAHYLHICKIGRATPRLIPISQHRRLEEFTAYLPARMPAFNARDLVVPNESSERRPIAACCSCNWHSKPAPSSSPKPAITTPLKWR